jgi:protein SCO1/2
MDFFFTNCPAICPALSRSMKQIQDAVGDRGVRLVSVSVDPKNDTEATLLAHSNELGADPAVWTFLRADDFEQVRVLSEDGLKLGLSLDDSRPIKTRLGDDMPWIDHSGKLLLLDSEARVIGLYSGLDERDVAALIQRLARATTPK